MDQNINTKSYKELLIKSLLRNSMDMFYFRVQST